MDNTKLSEQFRREILKKSVELLPGIEESEPAMISIFIDELSFMIGLAMSNAPEHAHEELIALVGTTIEDGIETVQRVAREDSDEFVLPSDTVH